ncbi:GNAT family N-acetyltransferase [Natrialba sp. INN-245]|uniref:GNAT family N-acetyltransferase n=1 Tax=Natrialba sp. INN-245 TaxID=2690967 RepID=UPI0013108FF7|nr:GNAT family N-acetyltransferase [Natrialba sp. INN-245]MWV40043.1 GNAT family N-acetyltransferase [Natrialba sp. INN-245]
MTIDVVPVTPEERANWNEFVAESPQGTIYHRIEFLEVLADHAAADLHLLIGYKSEEPRGIFPIFEQRKGPLRLVTSPPHGLGVPYLGPLLLNYQKMKQRKTDLSNKRFVEGCLEWIEETIDPHYSRIVTSWRFDDPRPFDWNGYDIDPKHTYRIPAGDEDELMRHVTKSARRSIKRNQDANVVVNRDDQDGLGFVYRTLERRYDEQDRTFTPPLSYLRDLDDALPADSVRTYVAELDAEPIMGRVVLQTDGCASFWKGMAAAKNRRRTVPVGDLLNWQTMVDAINHGADEFDLVGANTPRLCRYKGKFNPALEQYYVAERTARGVGTAIDFYKRWLA